jgi:hypothetical protein
LNTALSDSNAALNAALSAANAALKAALNASSAVEAVNVETRYELVGGAEKRERKSIDLDNPVAWQDAPDYNEANKKTNLSFYQAVTIATGHILHYKSLFKADGYSLGDLLYSLPLAPGQKKEIVVLDSSHTLVGAESQTVSQGERLAAGIVNERDITNQLGGNITEAVRGTSSANTSGISAGLGVGALIGPVGAVLGVSGGAANSNSTATQNSSRDVSQFFGEKLRQSIMQNAEGYRQLNASVVTTVQEGQRYGVTSEVVASQPLPCLDDDVLRGAAPLRHIPGAFQGGRVRVRPVADDEFFHAEHLQMARCPGEVPPPDALRNVFAALQFHGRVRPAAPAAEGVRRQRKDQDQLCQCGFPARSL